LGRVTFTFGTQHPPIKWLDKQTFIRKNEKTVPTPAKKEPRENKKGTRLPAEERNEIQQFMRNEMKKVPSWNEKGNKLLSRKNLYLHFF